MRSRRAPADDAPRSSAPLPNLFVLGAPKAGTTTLHRTLAEHPDIFMSPVKEPAFFSSRRRYEAGLGWYAHEFFRGSEGYVRRGESTPWYLYSRMAMDHIAEDLDDSTSFLVVLRDPVSRAYSMYWDQVAAGREHRTFRDAVQADRGVPSELMLRDEIPDAELITAYVTAGRYGAFLSDWFERFGRERFCVLIHDDLVNDPETQLGRLWRFLGVAPLPVADLPHDNRSSLPRSRTVERVLRLLESLPPGFKRFVRDRTGYGRLRRFAQALQRANRSSTSYPPLDPSEARRLRSTFEDDIRRLESLLGRSLDAWSDVP